MVTSLVRSLATLEEAYGHPVDIEFTATVEAERSSEDQSRPNAPSASTPWHSEAGNWLSVLSNAGKVSFRAGPDASTEG